MLNHGDLFSGVGGFSLAASWLGWNNIFQVENDPFCQKVLEKNFPETKRYGDIYEFKGEKYRGTIDIISGGFPCQPFSVAGKQKGKEDDRYLWPEMFRVIQEIRPTWVVAENVTGIISMGLDKTISDLESVGYEVQAFVIPACAVGAWHRRDRVWIVAYSARFRLENQVQKYERVEKLYKKRPSIALSAYIDRERFDISRDNEHLRRNSRVSNWMDRIKALGNAIVPQVAYEIFGCIDRIERAESEV